MHKRTTSRRALHRNIAKRRFKAATRAVLPIHARRGASRVRSITRAADVTHSTATPVVADYAYLITLKPRAFVAPSTELQAQIYQALCEMQLATSHDQVAIWQARVAFRDKHGGLVVPGSDPPVVAPSYLEEYHHTKPFPPPLKPLHPVAVAAWEHFLAQIEERAELIAEMSEQDSDWEDSVAMPDGRGKANPTKARRPAGSADSSSTVPRQKPSAPRGQDILDIIRPSRATQGERASTVRPSTVVAVAKRAAAVRAKVKAETTAVLRAVQRAGRAGASTPQRKAANPASAPNTKVAAAPPGAKKQGTKKQGAKKQATNKQGAKKQATNKQGAKKQAAARPRQQPQQPSDNSNLKPKRRRRVNTSQAKPGAVQKKASKAQGGSSKESRAKAPSATPGTPSTRKAKARRKKKPRKQD